MAYSAPDTYTDAQIVAYGRAALVELTISQSVTVYGRTVTRAQIPEILQLIEWAEDRIAIAGSASGGTRAYATFRAAR